MKAIQKTISVAVLTVIQTTFVCAGLPEVERSLGNASVTTRGDQLIVSTGLVERTWQWTGHGLVTTAIKGPAGDYPLAPSSEKADWDVGVAGEGELLGLSSRIDDDAGFTSQHIAVEAEIRYGELDLKYVIWAYPDAPGIRTQVWLKWSGQASGSAMDRALAPGITERIALAVPARATAFGYAAGLKNTTTEQQYNILETRELKDGERWDKASGLIIDAGRQGIVLIKESNTHTLMRSLKHNGAFSRKGSSFIVDGLGLTRDDCSGRYRFCWANWMIPYRGGEVGAQLALKRFDRARYPVDMESDVFIMANTWGTEDDQDQCFYKAREANVLREIEACADLGIDLLQIDEGWQISRRHWQPAEQGPMKPYFSRLALDGSISPPGKQVKTDRPPVLHDGTPLPPSYEVYPTGFGNVRRAAAAAGVDLGLWFHNVAPLEDLKSNYDAGKFAAFKLDFAHLTSKDLLDELYYKARDLIRYTQHQAVVNWDVTELSPRMGFYFGRECGNIYLANRKTFTSRRHVGYIPWRQLRDAWELAKYANLNQFQITINNMDLVPASAHAWTDAHLSTHGYNLAITLMSSPIFFSEMQYYSPQARDELRPIIAKYKQEREAIYQGYVFPIGSRPDNRSWSGLQNHNPETGDGYLTIFRERKNTEQQGRFQLHFLPPQTKLVLTDLMSGQEKTVTLGPDSDIEFRIPESPGFLFLKYRKN